MYLFTINFWYKELVNLVYYRDPYVNLLSAKNGSEAARSASDPLRSRMTSYTCISDEYSCVHIQL
jgi:hypothetical protein